MITFDEVKEKVVIIVSSQEVLQENPQDKVDEECAAENHAALELSNDECLNDLSAASIKVSSENVDVYDDSNNNEECNQPAVAKSNVSLPTSIAKPVKKEKPRMPKHLIVSKLKQKFNCEYHPLDVLESITNCYVYSDKKGNFCFQDKRIEKLSYLVNQDLRSYAIYRVKFWSQL